MATPTCALCGRIINPNATAGLCPRCLLGAALANDDSAPALPVPDPPPHLVSAASRQFGDYELLGEVARGGMGVVYRARQARLNRVVAIKLLLGGEWASAEFVHRFFAEAEAAARLDHPGIVPIHEIGVHEGQHFIAMKFIEGETLAARLARPDSRPSPADAVRLVATLARTVHYAHQRGVLHRDLKPGNVLLDPRGEPILTDFGLAKLLEQDTKLTRTHAVLGTPAYIAPELASGRSSDSTTSADVYGLGTILYELLAGEPPFSGGTAMEILRRVLECEPTAPSRSALRSKDTPPSRRRAPTASTPPELPSVDRDLDIICLKCLEKDPARRYGSAEALADDLERWLRGEPILARPIRPSERLQKWIRRNPTITLLTSILFLALVAISVISTAMSVRISGAREIIARQAEDRRQQIVHLNVATGNRLAEEGDGLTATLWFAEAARLEAQAGRNDDMHRYRLAAAWRHSPALEHAWFQTGAITSVRFSADGTRLLTASRDGTARLRWVANGEDVAPPLLHPAAVEAAEFAPDGKHVATLCADHQARLWNASTGAATGVPMRVDRGERNLAFSPDGRRIAAPVKGGAIVFDAATGEPVSPLLPHRGHVNFVCFSPDGRHVATVGEDQQTQVWLADTGELAFPAIRHHGALRRAAFSPDGAWLVCADDRLAVQLFEVSTGRPLSPVLQQQGMALDFSFTTDATQLLIAGEDNVARLWDPQRHETKLTLRHRGAVLQASFDPAEDRILTASRDGTARLWSATNGAPLFAPLREAGGLNAAAFSPDGTRVATAGRNGITRLWRLPETDGALFTLRHAGPMTRSAFSPDGRRLLTTAMDSVGQLWDLTTGEPASSPLPHSAGATYGAFLADGKRFITSSGEGILHTWDTADARELFALRHTNRFYTVGQSRDGSRLLTLTVDTAVHIWAASNGAPVFSTPPGTAATGWAELNADGTRLLACRRDGAWVLWDVASGQPACAPLAPGLGGMARLSPDGRRLAVATAGPKPFTRVWEFASTNWVTPRLEQENGIHFVNWSPDGQILATAAADNAVRLWSVANHREIAPPLRHDGFIYDVAFSPDSRRVLSAAGDFTARVWDAATGEPITPPLRHGAWVIQATFSPDGQRIATSSSDGRARVWDVSMATEPIHVLVARARLLASHELDGVAALRPISAGAVSNAWRTTRSAPQP